MPEFTIGWRDTMVPSRLLPEAPTAVVPAASPNTQSATLPAPAVPGERE
jgi:hypothetical protein